MQRDTLSSYPITLQQESVDIGGLVETMAGSHEGGEHGNDKIYSNNIMTDMVNTTVAKVNSNNLKNLELILKSIK